MLPGAGGGSMPYPIGYAVFAVSRAGAVMMHGVMQFLSTKYCVGFIISSVPDTVNRPHVIFNGSVTTLNEALSTPAVFAALDRPEQQANPSLEYL